MADSTHLFEAPGSAIEEGAKPHGEAGALSESDVRATRRLALGFALLAGITYVLIVLGALVRANGAGLACPDWPLCFGEVIPTFDVRVGFEWSHRALAGSVSLIFAALAILTLRNAALRSALLPLLVLEAVLIAVQVLLGALTVWHLLASWTVTSHLLVGNAIAITLVFIYLRLRELQRPAQAARAPVSPLLRMAIGASAAVLVVQLILGGLVSSNYAGLACPDWPSCRDGVWFPSFAGALGMQLSHRLGAYLLLTLLLCSALAARGTGALGRLLGAALVVGLLQGIVGILNVLWRLPVEVTGLHSALAAALACLLALSVRESLRART